MFSLVNNHIPVHVYSQNYSVSAKSVENTFNKSIIISTHFMTLCYSGYIILFVKNFQEAEEIVHCLSTCTALAEDLVFIPSTNFSSSQLSVTLAQGI